LAIRDFIPAKEEPTGEETARFGFGRDPLDPVRDFVPGEGHKSPVESSHEASVREAFEFSKAATKDLHKHESLLPFVEKMDSMHVNDAVEFVQAQSPHLQAKYLRAETVSKNRGTLLGHFGQSPGKEYPESDRPH
jgi:hypothetical protein